MMNEELNTLTVDDVNTVLRNHALPTFTPGSFDVALARVGARAIRDGLFDLERNARAVHFFWYSLIRDCVGIAARAGSGSNREGVMESGARTSRDRETACRRAKAIEAVSNGVNPVVRHHGRTVSPIHGGGQHSRDVVFACRMELRPMLVNGVPVSCANKEPEALVMEGLLRVAS
ncbi:hypothetical protein LV476_04900 [Guyparkeria hydrothermalis]|uniref:hypothetical protein n=1 Tax=Guyparkeria hydrothermalis TaxID=923 RepID=UPI0020214F03|nr:hypothetical protein [Guyparkeria hydrothermalis]MCL7744290.1 hypothetical protein [Guyparkeria hydrothermalis]